jgi:opacity protein-like surface antigen
MKSVARLSRTVVWALVFGLTLSFMLDGAARAQSLAGTQEMSISLQGGSVDEKNEFTDHHSGQTQTETYRSNFFTLGARYGYYIYHGLEIEPELMFTAIKDAETGISLHGNVAYNFSPKPAPKNPRLIPFLLAGFSIGNSIPYFHTFVMAPYEGGDSKNATGINLGFGIKTLVSDHAALRFEYRYEWYTQKHESSNSDSKVSDAFGNVLFGVSLFFPPKGK